MNRVGQHIPNFVDIDSPPPCADFETVEELLAVPFVAFWAADKDFFRWSVSEGDLIAEFLGGRKWWVVGHLRSPVVDLPQWDGGWTMVQFSNSGRPRRIAGRDIYSYCGEEVRLKDGRIGRKISPGEKPQ